VYRIRKKCTTQINEKGLEPVILVIMKGRLRCFGRVKHEVMDVEEER